MLPRPPVQAAIASHYVGCHHRLHGTRLRVLHSIRTPWELWPLIVGRLCSRSASQPCRAMALPPICQGTSRRLLARKRVRTASSNLRGQKLSINSTVPPRLGRPLHPCGHCHSYLLGRRLPTPLIGSPITCPFLTNNVLLPLFGPRPWYGILQYSWLRLQDRRSVKLWGMHWYRHATPISPRPNRNAIRSDRIVLACSFLIAIFVVLGPGSRIRAFLNGVHGSQRFMTIVAITVIAVFCFQIVIYGIARRSHPQHHPSRLKPRRPFPGRVILRRAVRGPVSASTRWGERSAFKPGFTLYPHAFNRKEWDPSICPTD